jgi:hypothetical protein
MYIYNLEVTALTDLKLYGLVRYLKRTHKFEIGSIKGNLDQN